MVALAIVMAMAGCHRGAGAGGARTGASCRAVAVTAERFVAGARPEERDAMLRFAVEVIDLCQAPGLSSATRKCVASAATPEDARACPALPLVPLHAALPAPSPEPDEGALFGDFVFEPDGVEGGEVDPLAP